MLGAIFVTSMLHALALCLVLKYATRTAFIICEQTYLIPFSYIKRGLASNLVSSSLPDYCLKF